MHHPSSNISAAVNIPACLLDHLSEAIIELDHEGKILHLNPKAEQLLDTASEQACGKLAWKLMEGIMNKPLQQLITQALKEKVSINKKLNLIPAGLHATLMAAPSPAGAVIMITEINENGTEQKLKEEHRKLNEAQAIGHVGSFRWEASTDIITWSNEMYRIHGLKPQAEAITLEKELSFIHPDDLHWVSKVIKEARQQPTTAGIIHRILTVAGDMRYINRRLQSFAGTNGKVTHITGTVQDISAQYKGRQDMKAQQDLFLATMDSSLDMIQVFEAVRNEQGEIIDFKWILNNYASENAYGNVIGKSLLEVNPGVVEEGIFDAFKKVVGTGIPDRSERHYVHEQFDGWFLQSTVKLNDGVATTTVDITARKKAEQELQQSKELLQDVIDAPNIGIAVYKAVRDKKGEIIDFVHEYINRASFNMLGGKDFTGKLFTEHGENAILQMPQFIEVIKTGKGNSYTREASFRGRKAWFAITNTPLDSERLVHTWEDVTEQKRSEEQIRISKENLQATLDGSLYFIQAFKAVRNESGKIIDFEWIFTNKMWNRHYGDVIGKSMLQQNPAVVETGLFNTFVKVVETGEPVDQEFFYSHEQFHEQWFHQTVVKMGDGFVMNNEDITGRKNAEHEILRLKDEIAQRAEEKYQALFNSIDDGFCILELICDDEGKVADLVFREHNPAFHKHTGLGNVIGQSMKKVLPDYAQSWIDKYKHVAETGEAVIAENYAQDAERWYKVQFLRIGNEASRFVATVFEDITERKLREQQQAYLLDLSDALRSTEDPVQIEEKVTALAMEYFGADRCYYCTIEGENSIIRRDARRHELPSVSGSYPLSSVALLKKVIDEGVPFVVHDAHTTDMLDEPLREICLQLNIVSFIDIPIIKSGKAAGVLCIMQSTPRNWSQGEIQVAVETAERTWAAVERAKVEETLKRSEAKFRRLSDSGIVAVAFFDTGGPIMDANNAFLDMLGLTKEELSSETVRWDVYTPKEWMPRTLEAVEELKQTGFVRPYEKQFYHSSGELRWGLFAGAMLEDSTTGVSLVVDITERKRAEAALHASEKRLAAFVDAVPVAIGMTGTDGRFTFFNKEMQRFLPDNIMPSQNQSYKRWSAWYPDGTPVERENFPGVRALRGETVVPGIEMLYTPREDSMVWTRVMTVPVKNEKGDISGAVVAITDISEIKKSEIALRVADERYRTQLEKEVEERTAELKKQQALLREAETIGQMGGWEKDLHTGELLWSDELYRIYGLEPQSVPVTSDFYIENFLHPKDRKKVRNHIHGIYEKHSQKPAEYRIITPHGEKNLFSQPHITFDGNGRPITIRGIVRDITAQKKAEEELVRLKLVQQKELLNAVLMAQEAERERIGEALHNGVGQLLYGIKIRTELLKLKSESLVQLREINQVLDEAISETRSISFQLVPTVLKDFGVQHALGSLLERIVRPGLHFTLDAKELKHRLPENIEIGIYRIAQELANNIIKHSKATAAQITLSRNEKHILLEVQDNGVGFDELQVNAMHKGFGLQSIRNRAQLLNASLSIRSNAGEGTKVVLEIPVKMNEVK